MSSCFRSNARRLRDIVIAPRKNEIDWAPVLCIKYLYPEDVVAQRLAPPVKSLIDFLKHSHARCQQDRHWNIFVEIDALRHSSRRRIYLEPEDSCM